MRQVLMTVVLVVCGIGLGTPQSAFAQATLVLHEFAGDTEHLGEVAGDGSVTVSTESAADCCWTSNVTAYDPETDRIFFLGGKIAGDPASSTRRVVIYDYDGVNLSVTVGPALSSDYNYNFLEYDTSTDTLYAMAYNSALASSSGNTTRQHELLTVNPATGAVATVGSPISDCCWISTDVSTFDQSGGSFIFLGAKYSDGSSQTRRVFTVDVSDGSVDSSPQLDGGSTDYRYNFMELDPGTGNLYTFAYNAALAASSNPQVKREELHRINPTTGALTMVGSGVTDCCSVSSNSAAFDSGAGALLFVAAYTTSSSDKRLFSIDPADGSVDADPVIDTGATSYAINGLEYRIDPDTCYDLTTSHTGSGSDPVVSPTESTGCTTGMYKAGEALVITVTPDAGWIAAAWEGTDDDSSHANTNTATMPIGSHSIVVHYAVPIALMDFETGDTSQWSSAVGEAP